MHEMDTHPARKLYAELAIVRKFDEGIDEKTHQRFFESFGRVLNLPKAKERIEKTKPTLSWAAYTDTMRNIARLYLKQQQQKQRRQNTDPATQNLLPPPRPEQITNEDEEILEYGKSCWLIHYVSSTDQKRHQTAPKKAVERDRYVELYDRLGRIVCGGIIAKAELSLTLTHYNAVAEITQALWMKIYAKNPTELPFVANALQMSALQHAAKEKILSLPVQDNHTPTAAEEESPETKPTTPQKQEAIGLLRKTPSIDPMHYIASIEAQQKQSKKQKQITTVPPPTKKTKLWAPTAPAAANPMFDPALTFVDIGTTGITEIEADLVAIEAAKGNPYNNTPPMIPWTEEPTDDPNQTGVLNRFASRRTVTHNTPMPLNMLRPIVPRSPPKETQATYRDMITTTADSCDSSATTANTAPHQTKNTQKRQRQYKRVNRSTIAARAEGVVILLRSIMRTANLQDDSRRERLLRHKLVKLHLPKSPFAMGINGKITPELKKRNNMAISCNAALYQQNLTEGLEVRLNKRSSYSTVMNNYTAQIDREIKAGIAEYTPISPDMPGKKGEYYTQMERLAMAAILDTRTLQHAAAQPEMDKIAPKPGAWTTLVTDDDIKYNKTFLKDTQWDMKYITHPLQFTTKLALVPNNTRDIPTVIQEIEPENCFQCIPPQFRQFYFNPQHSPYYSQTDRVVFEKRVREKGYFFAFHGTSPENIHSIADLGLMPACLTKNQAHGNVYGQGVYATMLMDVAISYSSRKGATMDSRYTTGINKKTMHQAADSEKEKTPFTPIIVVQVAGTPEDYIPDPAHPAYAPKNVGANPERAPVLVIPDASLVMPKFLFVGEDHELRHMWEREKLPELNIIKYNQSEIMAPHFVAAGDMHFDGHARYLLEPRSADMFLA